ncbi:MAG: SDR family oxidoreductase [Candidatus Neomarinimicrobiota bacterium]
MTDNQKPVVFIHSISSDIGIAMAQRYQRDGFTVAGTYRSRALLHQLQPIPASQLFYCDLLDRESQRQSLAEFADTGLRWDTYISCASIPTPLTKFFECDFDEFKESIHVNAVEQLRFLHGLFPYRNNAIKSDIVFWGGPGINGAVSNFSALTVAKLMLLKFCELLNLEYQFINAFILGPGWTKTKAHNVILQHKDVSAEKFAETKHFLENESGTSMDDIYSCLRWLCDQGRAVAGGRNFSVVHDHWGTAELKEELLNDPDMYKLRRNRNNWKDRDNG